VEKLLKLDRPVAERFYAPYREQFNPDLTVPESLVEEWISVGTFRVKEKSPSSRNRSSIGRLPKKPDADHQSTPDPQDPRASRMLALARLDDREVKH
jgi:hypothetical protein